MDLTKILKLIPKGTKLYCTTFGEVKLLKINNSNYPIVTDKDSFTNEGKYHSNGECVLFPSKENRNWDTFNPFIEGEIYKTDDSYFIHKKYPNNYYKTSYLVGIKKTQEIIEGKKDRAWAETNYPDIHLANEEERKYVLETLEKNGYHYNKETISLCKTYPVDTPMMVSHDNTEWALRYYSGKNNACFVFSEKSNEAKRVHNWNFMIPVEEFDFVNRCKKNK